MYFAGALRDYIGISVLQRTAMYSFNLTWQDYDSAHFIMLAAHEKLNVDLLDWIGGIGV